MASSDHWVVEHANLVLDLRPHCPPRLVDAAELGEGRKSGAADARAWQETVRRDGGGGGGGGGDLPTGLDQKAWTTGKQDKKAGDKVGLDVWRAYARSGSVVYAIGLVLFAVLAQVSLRPRSRLLSLSLVLISSACRVRWPLVDWP